MLQVHKLASTPSHLLQIKRQSVRCFGVKLFNSLPKHIRNITNTTVDKFKRKLDTFLNTIDDHPHLRSGANTGSYSSNHLYDCITLNNSEQYTPGVLNYSPLGEAIMSRGLASSETMTLMQWCTKANTRWYKVRWKVPMNDLWHHFCWDLLIWNQKKIKLANWVLY